MEAEFWKQRWQTGRIGFHSNTVNPHLRALSDALPGAGSRVLVPLCGKSVDMVYLAELGLQVVGVELSPLAAQAFFDALGQTPERRADGPFQRWTAGGVTILQGDLFELPSLGLPAFDAIWDRAALIALPESMRSRYVRTMAESLAPKAPYLLVTMDIPGRDTGPPFSMREADVYALYDEAFECLSEERLAITSADDPFAGADELRFLMRLR